MFKNELLDVENDLIFYPPATKRSRKLLFYMSYATDIVPIMAPVKGTCCINPPKQVKPASAKRSGATVVKCVLARARTCPVLSPAAQPRRANLPSMFLLKYFVAFLNTICLDGNRLTYLKYFRLAKHLLSLNQIGMLL